MTRRGGSVMATVQEVKKNSAAPRARNMQVVSPHETGRVYTAFQNNVPVVYLGQFGQK